MANDYVIEADMAFGSVPEIQALWVRNLHGHSAASASAKAELGYLHNPAGPGVLLALRPGAGQPICGAQGLHPRRLHLGEHSLNAAGLADFAVDTAHRSVGPALMLTRQAVQLGRQRYALLYGLPNQKAQGVCLRAGMRKLGMVQRHAKLLRCGDRLRRRMPGWVSRVLEVPGDALLGLADRLLQLREPQRLRLRDAGWDDPALDALWARRPRELLLSERSAGMLRWRFGESARGAWALSLAVDAQGVAAGYLVWRHHQGAVQVADLFCARPQDTAAAVLALARRLRAEGVASLSLEFFGCPEVVQCLRRAGFLPRPQQTLLVKAPTPDRPALDEPHRWHVTGFDNDAD